MALRDSSSIWQRTRRKPHQVLDRVASRALAKDGDFRGIASEGFDVRSDSVQGESLVVEACVLLRDGGLRGVGEAESYGEGQHIFPSPLDDEGVQRTVDAIPERHYHDVLICRR